MTSITGKVIGELGGSIVWGACGATSGASGGFIYAKLADLPVDQVAKAWAVWLAAEFAIFRFATAFVQQNSVAYHLIRATITTVSGIIGIQELQKRGLIGEKMTIFIIVIRMIGVAYSLIAAATSPARAEVRAEMR